MRIVARSTLESFAKRHPEARTPLKHWLAVTKSANWTNMHEIQQSFPSAKVLNGERARFEINGGNYRLIVAFKFRSKLCFVKFIGTHVEYDRIDAFTVSQY